MTATAGPEAPLEQTNATYTEYGRMEGIHSQSSLYRPTKFMLVPRSLPYETPDSMRWTAHPGRSASDSLSQTEAPQGLQSGSITGASQVLPENEKARAPEEDQPAPSRERKEMILLAEDEVNIREMMVGLLSSSGYEVLEARDGQEALDVFQANEEDVELAVLDMVMPKVSGIAVLEHISRSKPSCAVILTSGYEASKFSNNQEALQKALFVEKPYLPRDMLEAVRKVLNDRNDNTGK